RLTRGQLRRMYSTRYPRSNLTIAAVGDLNLDQLPQRLETLFRKEKPPSGAAAKPLRLPRMDGRRRAVFWSLPREQAHLVIGFPGVTLSDPDRYPLEILAQLLSGQGGRLFTEVREKRGLVYSIGAFSLEGLDPGYFAVHAATSPDSVPAVVGQIRQELARIIDEGGVSQAELQRVQRHLIGAHAIGLQRRSALAATLAFREAYGLGWQSYREYADRLREVKVADLARVAQKYWDPKREVLSVVGPQKALSQWGSEIAQGAAQEFHQP
ncbi:MAG TPA: pitrilysin family protein, partial [Polyangia bacterium]